MTQIDAAKIQLECAMRLFTEENDYVSALTLAGAAEGILGGLRKKRHEERIAHEKQDDLLPNAFEERRSLYAFLSDGDTPDERKKIGQFIRSTRNALNHPAADLDGELRTEAEEWISMAISDLVGLTGCFPDDQLYIAFCRATSDGQDTPPAE